MSGRGEKAKKLREALKQPRAVLIGGVYDGLSGALAERAGFDGLWASGFCISSSKRIPDVGLVTMTEHLAATTEIDRATSLPVVADVDDGFGDALNVMRMVKEYEAAGIAAICLEDNQHPKRNSLYAGLDRKLVSAEAFAVKIRAAREARVDPAFVIIARTEALVAGMGLPEAMRRANAYAEAGADMILVHSKEPDPALILEFGAQWNRPIPLAAVPTTYAGASVSDLYARGYRLVIFANQGMRAAVRAMDLAFRRMVETKTPSSVDGQISPLSEIFDLVGMDGIRALEDRLAAPPTKITDSDGGD